MTSTLGGLDTFDYDAVDMVTRARVENITRVYLYTADDERLASIPVASGVESCLLIDGQQICPEWTLRDASARVLRRLEKNGETWNWKEDYIYAGSTLVAAEVDAPEKTRHFFTDHLGTSRLITGSGGTQIAQHTYYPFGGEASSSTQENEKFKFTSHERDAGSLDYMHARYYAPKWGRFLSVDPGGFGPRKPQSWNRYEYVMNNPINNNDPNGRETNPVTGESFILDSQILNSANNPRKGFFGMVRRNLDGSRKKHGGNDIAAPRGTPVFAPVSRTVIQSGDGGKDGGFVLRIRRSTDENGQPVFVHISHLNQAPSVKVGETVVEGQPNEAQVGNTGNAKREPPHAHTAVMVGGENRENQVDPQQWFRDHPSTAQPEKAKEPCEPNKKC